MKILYVAYPLLPVSDASAGGAEQMLWTLEREMHNRGHETVVAACAGSQVSGRLFTTGEPPSESDTFDKRDAQHQHAIRNLLQYEPFDLIHDKSGSFFLRAGNLHTPVLATLHLPRSFYPTTNWSSFHASMTLNCVSVAQAHTFADVPSLAGWVQNGIAIDRFPISNEKESYLLWLGRICEEKSPHLAIEVARRAGRKLILAGQVYPFHYHQEYFAREVQPRLGGDVTFIDSPTFATKLDLLAHAAALLITSQAEETSSLVAMEAMACGTPVVTFGRGAVPEVVAHERTGFVVNDLDSMARATADLRKLSSVACRAHVERYFSATRMADDYERHYARVVERSMGEAA